MIINFIKEKMKRDVNVKWLIGIYLEFSHLEDEQAIDAVAKAFDIDWRMADLLLASGYKLYLDTK